MTDRISPAQIRGARGMLDWSMIDLSKAAGVSVCTVRRAEERHGSAVSQRDLNLLEHAFELAGIVFLHDGEACRGMMVKQGRGHRQEQDEGQVVGEDHASSLCHHRPSSPPTL